MFVQPFSASERAAMCIDACENCHRACTAMAMNYCLVRGGQHARQDVMRQLLNCAQLCRLAADFQLTRSTFAEELCSLCASVCEACAETCTALEGLEDCAQACQECADSCRHLLHPEAPERMSMLQ